MADVKSNLYHKGTLLHKPSIDGLLGNIISKWISLPLKSTVQPIGPPIIKP